jgi:hypothetical protein
MVAGLGLAAMELTQMKFLIKSHNLPGHSVPHKAGAAASDAAWETPGRRP